MRGKKVGHGNEGSDEEESKKERREGGRDMETTVQLKRDEGM